MPAKRKPPIKQANTNQRSPSTRLATAGSPLAPKVATEPAAGKPPAATASNSVPCAKKKRATPSTLRTTAVNNGNAQTMTRTPQQTAKSSTAQRNTPRPAAAETHTKQPSIITEGTSKSSSVRDKEFSQSPQRQAVRRHSPPGSNVRPPEKNDNKPSVNTERASTLASVQAATETRTKQPSIITEGTSKSSSVRDKEFSQSPQPQAVRRHSPPGSNVRPPENNVNHDSTRSEPFRHPMKAPRPKLSISNQNVIRSILKKPLISVAPPLEKNISQEQIAQKIEALARDLSNLETTGPKIETTETQMPTPHPPPPVVAPVVAALMPTAVRPDPKPSVQLPCPDVDCEVSGSTKVRFGDGLYVEMVTTPADPTRIVISGFPPKLTLQELGRRIQPLGTVLQYDFNVDSSITGKAGARVRFAHYEEALNAIQKLDGNPGLGTTLPLVAKFDTLQAPNLTSTNIVTDTVLIRWRIPEPKLRLYYKEPKIARQELDVINRRLFDGRPLKATLRATQHVIVVEGLSRNADIKEIVRRHSPDEDPYFLENYDHKQVMDQMTRLVSDHPNLRHHHVKQVSDSVTIVARFHTTEGAEGLLMKSSEWELPWRGAAKLQIIHARDLLYIMTRDKYCCLKKQIEDLRHKLAEANIILQVLTPQDHQQYQHIRIRGGRHIKDYKSMIDGILNGEVVMDKRHPLWDDDLELLYGPDVFSNIAVLGVTIRADTRRKRITVFGLDDRRAAAIRRIRLHIATLKCGIHSQKFPRWQFSYWDTMTRQILANVSGEQNVYLDSRLCQVIVVGDEVGKWLQTVADQAPKQPSLSVSAAGEIHCPVCLDIPAEPITMPCKHHYCKACLTRYLVSATQPGASFPFRCFGSNKNKCNNPIPFAVIRNLLTQDQLEVARDRSLEFHVNTRPQEYRHCPTSECPQIFRVRKKSDTPELPQHCQSCLIKFCASCFIEGGHDGRTCAQYAAYQDQLLKDKDREVEEWIRSLGGRTCPKCNMGLIKDGGCAHVQCSRCKVHICWTCGKAFEEVAEESVYEHMRREHGGIGLFDFAGGDLDGDVNADLRYIIEEHRHAPVNPSPPRQQLTASTSGSSGGSPNSSRAGTKQGTQKRKVNRKPKSNSRRQTFYRDYGHEPSEDENDDFGGGDWDYDYGDMNWEAI